MASPPHWRIGHILEFAVRSKEPRNVGGAGTMGARIEKILISCYEGTAQIVHANSKLSVRNTAQYDG